MTASSKTPCPFCEIVAGRLSAEIKVWDTEAVIFVPLNPVTKGHVLVVPALHVEDFTTMPKVSAWVMEMAADYAGKVGGEWNLITSKGRAATQTVFHLHLHLVPRREGDGLRLPWTDQHKREMLQRMVDNPPFPSGLVRVPPTEKEQKD